MNTIIRKITTSISVLSLATTTMFSVMSFTSINALADDGVDADEGTEKITLVSDKESKSEDCNDSPVAFYIETEPGTTTYSIYDYSMPEGNNPPHNNDKTISADKSLDVNIPKDADVVYTQIEIGNGPELNITFQGDLVSEEESAGRYTYGDGLYFERFLEDNGSNASIEVKGDITARSKGYRAGPSNGVHNVEDDDYTGQPTIQVTVDGNISASAESVNSGTLQDGGRYTDHAIAHGVDAEGNCLVTVKGDVTANAVNRTGRTEAIGVLASKGADVTVEKNIKSSATGVQVNTQYVNSANPSLIIVKGDIMAAGSSVHTNIGDSYNDNQLPTYILGTLKDENGNPLANAGEKLTVSSSDPEIVKKVIDKIYYIADTSGMNYKVRIEGLKQIDEFDGYVAQAGDVLTMSVGSSSVLEGVEAGPYAKVEKVNEYTYLITVNHGGGLKLKGIWTPAVTAEGSDDSTHNNDNSQPAANNTYDVQAPQGSVITVDRSNAGGNILAIDMNSIGGYDLSVSDLLTYLTTEGVNDLVIKTPAGNFTIPIADLLTLAGNNSLIRFVLRNGCLDVYIGTQLVTTFTTVN